MTDELTAREGSDQVELSFAPMIPPSDGGHPGRRSERVELPADGLILDRDVELDVGDGAVVLFDIYRPIGSTEALPILVNWSPFGKHRGGMAPYAKIPGHGVERHALSEYTPFEAIDPAVWCAWGYAVVNVDLPGTWESSGDLVRPQRSDGRAYATLIDWLGSQPWSNGRVGLAGMSWLAMSQWWAAAEHPEHLAAINPCDGYTDAYRDSSYHGGIPETRFSRVGRRYYGHGRREDTVLMAQEHPLFDEYWASKAVPLEEISVPAYVIASSSDHGIHTRGTLEGFRRIGSSQKWLEIHGRKKWERYYDPEQVDRMRAFFDRFLLDRETEVSEWPAVRYEVRKQFYVGREQHATDWPIPETRYRELHLDAASGALTPTAPAESSALAYVADGSSTAVFEHRFDGDTVVAGGMRLELWVEARGSDDIDLFVAVRKLDRDRSVVGFPIFSTRDDGPVGLGWLRVSHRELDPVRSTDDRPFHRHDREQLLGEGEIVKAVVEIWPTATEFLSGESLQLVVSGAEIYDYPRQGTVHHGETRNVGEHILHTGGEHASRLHLPTVPATRGAAS